jgi:hypothetical protein
MKIRLMVWGDGGVAQWGISRNPQGILWGNSSRFILHTLVLERVDLGGEMQRQLIS